MKAKQFTLFVLSAAIGLAIVLSGCRPATPTATPVPLTPTAILPTATHVPPTPTALPPTPTATPAPIPEPSEAIQATLWQLANQFRVSMDQVHLVRWERVDWSNGCLSIPMRAMCTEAIVPGYRIVVEIGGQEYEYRSTLPDADPYRLLLAAGPDPGIKEPALVWEGWEDNGCQSLILAADGRAAIGPCDAPHMPLHHFAHSHFLEFWKQHWLRRFAPFQAETPAGRVIFQGQGQEVASPAWQRALAAWARLVRMELQFGRSGASWGAALAWHREIPGRPGYCQFLGVETYGLASASVARCGGGDAQDLGQRWLDTAEWEQFDAWFYGREPVYHEELDFFSTGTQEMNESEVDALRRWAEEVHAHLAQPTPTPPVTVAPPPGLVYRTTDGLWRVDANGKPQQLLPNPEAQLSPDGQRALYTNEQGVWVVDLATGEERNLLAAGGYHYWCCPRWAGNEMVLFGSWPEGSDPGPSTGYLTAAAADGSWVRVLDQTSVSYGLPAASPDGQTIAYDRSGTAWLYHWESGPEPFGVVAYNLPPSKSIKIGSPAWSPDGRQLAWVVGGGFGDGWRIGIAVFDLEARASRLLHPYDPLGVGGWPGAPVWSPDGQWLAYLLAHATDPAQSGLWVLRADGQDERWLGNGGNPVWSPEGRWFVFTQPIAEQETAVWLLEAGVWDPQLMDLPAGAVSVGWASTLIRYTNPTLGFAVDHPSDWEVRGPANQVDPLLQSWSVIEFMSNLYAYGEQAFGKYAARVAVGESMGRTLTETVEYNLSPIMPQFREGIKTYCCLTVGGESAMEVLGFPLMRWGSRQIVVIHEGREYRLTFYPQSTLAGKTPSDAAARAAFDAFLRTFTFIPITATPIPPTPTITPVPTPHSQARGADVAFRSEST